LAVGAYRFFCTRAARAATLLLMPLAAAPLQPPPAHADDALACVSYADNAAKARSIDAATSNRYFSGEYARAFIARFAAIIGGAPDGVVDVASISTHSHASGASQSVDVRFYGANGCDLGPGATLALFLFTAIVQDIGTGA